MNINPTIQHEQQINYTYIEHKLYTYPTSTLAISNTNYTWQAYTQNTNIPNSAHNTHHTYIATKTQLKHMHTTQTHSNIKHITKTRTHSY